MVRDGAKTPTVGVHLVAAVWIQITKYCRYKWEHLVRGEPKFYSVHVYFFFQKRTLKLSKFHIYSMTKPTLGRGTTGFKMDGDDDDDVNVVVDEG